MAAWAESLFLKLVDRGGARWLLHLGTGEKVAFDVDGCEDFKLDFSSDGVGILMHDSLPHILTASLLDLRTGAGQRPGSSDEEPFIFSNIKGASRWLRDVAEEFEVRAVAQTDARGASFTHQVYLFPVPVAERCTIWWALPQVIDIVFQNQVRSNYVGKQKASFEKLFQELGLSHQNLRPSMQSLSTCKHRHKHEIAAPAGGILQYWTVTTKGLVVLLLNWQLHPSKMKECPHCADLAKSVLDSILDRVCFSGSFAVAVNDNPAFLTVSNGLVNLAELRQSGHAGIRVLCDRFKGVPSATSGVPLQSFLLELLVCVQRPSRMKSMPAPFAQAMLAGALEAIHLQLEVSKHEPWWSLTSCLQLSPQHDGKHRRVMSVAYKEAVRVVVKDTSEPLSVRSLVGAASILAADGKDSRVDAKDAAKSIKHDHAFRYLSSGRKEFASPTSLHFTIDGVRAGGDENNIFVAWLPRKKLAGIPPIQVWHCNRDDFVSGTSHLGVALCT